MTYRSGLLAPLALLLMCCAVRADIRSNGRIETGSPTSGGGGAVAVSSSESVSIGASGEVLVASRADPIDEAKFLIEGGWVAKYLIDEEGIYLFLKNGAMKLVPYSSGAVEALGTAGAENMAGGAATAAGDGVAGEAVGGTALGGTGLAIGGAIIAAEVAVVAYEIYLIRYYNGQQAAAEQQYINMGGTQQQINQNNQNAIPDGYSSLYWYYFWHPLG
jgi:hypothetical protein